MKKYRREQHLLKLNQERTKREAMSSSLEYRSYSGSRTKIVRLSLV